MLQNGVSEYNSELSQLLIYCRLMVIRDRHRGCHKELCSEEDEGGRRPREEDVVELFIFANNPIGGCRAYQQSSHPPFYSSLLSFVCLNLSGTE